jgi:hypothetical protein
VLTGGLLSAFLQRTRSGDIVELDSTREFIIEAQIVFRPEEDLSLLVGRHRSAAL